MRNEVNHRVKKKLFISLFHFLQFLSKQTEIQEKLPVSSNKKLVVRSIAECIAGCIEVIRFVSVASEFGVKEEIIVLIGAVIGGLAVESFGD